MTPEQAKALRESATNIIAHEKQLEAQRAKLYDELERANANARQAVMMAEEASREGDRERTATFNESAELIAQHIVDVDSQIARLDIELIEARQASDEAKSMASDSAIRMAQAQAKSAELKAEFERAKLGETAAEGVPSFDEVKDKIGERLVRAEAAAEIAEADGGEGSSLAGATAMVEEAAAEARARAKLAEIRSQMGVAAPDPAPTPDDPSDADPSAS